MFKGFFSAKSSGDPSEFMCYTSDGVKGDAKIHTAILAKGDSDTYKSLSVARLRARTGEDLEFITSLIS